jgi:small subunit ribosomal protein S13
MFKFKDSSKSLHFNLLNIYGIGSYRAGKIATLIGTTVDTKLNVLPGNKLDALQQIIAYYSGLNDFTAMSQNLSRFNKTNIGRLIKIGSYRGRRHKMRLPTRGQRTRSNAKSVRRALKY